VVFLITKTRIMTARTAAILFGIVFIIFGIVGYISNPVVGASDDTLFHSDSLHNIVHIASGVLFLLFGIAAPQNASGFLKVFGIIYFVIGVIGLINIGSAGMTKVLGFLHVNQADNYLHIGLGLIILLAGIFLPKSTVVSY
jgi:hypothetical protein